MNTDLAIDKNQHKHLYLSDEISTDKTDLDSDKNKQLESVQASVELSKGKTDVATGENLQSQAPKHHLGLVQIKQKLPLLNTNIMKHLLSQKVDDTGKGWVEYKHKRHCWGES